MVLVPNPYSITPAARKASLGWIRWLPAIVFFFNPLKDKKRAGSYHNARVPDPDAIKKEKTRDLGRLSSLQPCYERHVGGSVPDPRVLLPLASDGPTWAEESSIRFRIG